MSSHAVDLEWQSGEVDGVRETKDAQLPAAPEAQERFYVEHQSWSQLKKMLTDSRYFQNHMVYKPPHEFQFVLKNDPEGLYSHRVYFLAMSSEDRENTLFYAEIPKRINKHAVLFLTWKPLLQHFHSQDFGEYHREDELLRERKRIGTRGIMTYDFHRPSGTFLFQTGGSIYTLKDGGPNGFTNQPIMPERVPTGCPNIRMDPKLCPVDPSWFCFIHNRDLWLGNLESGEEQRLTFTQAETGEPTSKEGSTAAGMATFLLQEEFDRYTGFWWCPVTESASDGCQVLRVLYEETDESEVEMISLPSPMLESRLTESFRYPRAGTGNPKSTFKLCEIRVNTQGEVVEVTNKCLVRSVEQLFPGTEYITRAGWTSDGRFAWALLLNRAQTRQQLVLLPQRLFAPQSVLADSCPGPDSVTPFIIYQESTDIWINTHDILHFLPQTDEGEITVILASEVHTGFRHLYRVTAQLQACWGSVDAEGGLAAHDFLCPIKEQVALTWGEWEVLGRHGSNITVDEERGLLFFQGTRDSPLEHHLYVTSWLRPTEPCRVSQASYSHTCHISQLMDMYVSRFSNEMTPPSVKLYRMSVEGQLEQVQGEFWASLMQYPVSTDYVPPELFSFDSRSGHTLYGMLFHPHNLQPGKQYPVVLFVYGGPQVQLVNRRFKGLKFIRLHTMASLGYCVVVIDNRGSCHRGLAFESALKHRMGQVEIDDQVEGLEYLSSRYNFLDMDRVAIHGWSYGGFLSLMGLLQRPHFFKVAIAGAPVTLWTHYDTGYTERYMGMPDQNQDNYQLGSIALQAHRFPSQPGRLLLLHGMLDENVHFAHTNLLLSVLVRAGKPYHLQLYPQERHSIRLSESSEHYEVHLLHFLQDNLGSEMAPALSAS